MSSKLRLYNTLSRRKEVFHSISPWRVKMFVCGPTIQDYIHVGHARTYIFYDLLSRYLHHLGYSVEFLLNITDIDEHIVHRAKTEGMGIDQLQSKFGSAFLADLKALKIRSVTEVERVSKYLPRMIQQISQLLKQKNGYVADGSVYFDVNSYPYFGSLSHMTKSEFSLRPLEISSKKRNQYDFALWRRTTEQEQQWSSPWGAGTPGWHIQDTALSATSFGPQYDIHGGARELIYPHHEAEIAQMESLTGARPFVRYWVHTGLLTLGRRKMSKSEGNVFYVRDVLKTYGAGALRLYLMRMHHTRDEEFHEGELKQWEEKYWSMCARFKSVKDRAASRGVTPTRQMLQPFLGSLSNDIDGKNAIDYLCTLLSRGAQERDVEISNRIFAATRIASTILGVEFDND
jgi:cysteinyl-tRNA synthetase